VVGVARFEYSKELEEEFVREGESIRDIAEVIIEIAMKVAEPWDSTNRMNVVAISRNDGIADYIYVYDKMFRAPWRTVFPVILKQYGAVVIDWMKVVKKERVIEEIRREIEEQKAELFKIARRKSKYAMEMKEILEKSVDRLTRALEYLT
jgi:hypothetical protein